MSQLELEDCESLPDPINDIQPVVLCRKCNSRMGGLRVHEGSSASKANCRGKICQTVCSSSSFMIATILNFRSADCYTLFSALAMIVTLQCTIHQRISTVMPRNFFGGSNDASRILLCPNKPNSGLLSHRFLQAFRVLSSALMAA